MSPKHPCPAFTSIGTIGGVRAEYSCLAFGVEQLKKLNMQNAAMKSDFLFFGGKGMFFQYSGNKFQNRINSRWMTSERLIFFKEGHELYRQLTDAISDSHKYSHMAQKYATTPNFQKIWLSICVKSIPCKDSN